MSLRRLLLTTCLVALPLGASGLEREVSETRARLVALQGAVESHLEATGSLPESPAHLGVLTRLYATGVPLQGGVPVDAWGGRVVYRLDAEREEGYALYAPGPNGADDAGEGDDLGLATAVLPVGMRRAQQLLPVVVLVTVGPIAFAAIRAARRSAVA